MGLSLTHLLILLLVVFILFGAGKLPAAMRDIGKGVRNLKEGMKGDDEPAKKEEPKRITASHQPSANQSSDDKIAR